MLALQALSLFRPRDERLAREPEKNHDLTTQRTELISSEGRDVQHR